MTKSFVVFEFLVNSRFQLLENEINKAKEELRAQVSALVIRGAEQVLEDNVDAGKHQEMLNKLAAEL